MALLLAIWAVCVGQSVSRWLDVRQREESVVALLLAIWAVCVGQSVSRWLDVRQREESVVVYT